jgi:hypothetical protein
MARTSLAERQARLDQQRARLQREETRLRDDARKQRTRRLIQAGGLLAKAGLLELDANVLYGALLHVAHGANQPEQRERWRASGGRAFDQEAKARDAGRVPLILTLPHPAPAPLQAQLRQAGFRWSKVMRHWEGLAVHDEAQALATAHGGTLRRVDGAAAPPTDSEVHPAPNGHGAG